MARVHTGARGPLDRIDVPPSSSGWRTAKQAQADETIEKISWLMDRSIPLGGKFSIGLDGILGLIPGAGDVISGLISSYVIVHAHRAGIPKATLLRMVANVGIDSVVGAIPLVGDLFDFVFKANTKNLQLYREAMSGTRDTRRDKGFLIVLLLAVAGLVAIPLLLAAWVLQAIF